MPCCLVHLVHIGKHPQLWHTACINHGHAENTGTDSRSRDPAQPLLNVRGLTKQPGPGRVLTLPN
jgi:hypothetical protein